MFRVVWDKPRNGVLLRETAPDDEVLAVPPRPVFFEELDLLGLDKHGWQYPRCEEPLLWACERRYFYRGELVLEARGGNIYDAPKLVFHGRGDCSKTFALKPVNLDRLRATNAELMFLLEYEAIEFVHNTWLKYGGLARLRDLGGMNRLDFEALQEVMQKRDKKPYAIVKQDCDSFDILPLDTAESLGKQTLLSTHTEMFIASFSGGKDSQVVLDLVTRAVPPDAFLVIYSDTGYEIPPSLDTWERTRQFYKQRHPSLQFHLSKNHQDVLYYWDKMGSPSRMHRWCCGVMKTAPLYKELKEIFGKERQPHVLTYEGSRGEESQRRSGYGRIGKEVKHNNVINARPIFHWNATEIYLYLFERNLPINQGYRNGLSRVGCSICPFSTAWSEQIVKQTYPASIEKFIGAIEKTIPNIRDKDVYIKEGSWKLRAGGKNNPGDGSWLEFITLSPDFVANVSAPRENLLEWMKTLGVIRVTGASDSETVGEISYHKKIYSFNIIKNDSGLTFRVPNTGNDISFQSHLRRVLYKTTYCVHCEVCEVECPVGALSVVPVVAVDGKKCIRCHKCLDFTEKGCVSAKSQNTPEGTKRMNDKQTSIDRYSGFGLRGAWLAKFCAIPETFFETRDHGLNPNKQIPPLTCWLREAEMLNRENKKPSALGNFLAARLTKEETKVWEIVWINLSATSTIAKWYVENIAWGTRIPKPELLILLGNYFEGSYKERTLYNALEALLNMFKESPLGTVLKIGLHRREGQKTFVSKLAYEKPSLAAIAYSLYRYAEHNGRHNLTVGEFFAENQKSGIYRQFGISRAVLETALRTLKEEKNRVLDADLNMGLDNIKLREDLTSAKVLELLF